MTKLNLPLSTLASRRKKSGIRFDALAENALVIRAQIDKRAPDGILADQVQKHTKKLVRDLINELVSGAESKRDVLAEAESDIHTKVADEVRQMAIEKQIDPSDSIIEEIREYARILTAQEIEIEKIALKGNETLSAKGIN
jgi:urease gamma subunit